MQARDPVPEKLVYRAEIHHHILERKVCLIDWLSTRFQKTSSDIRALLALGAVYIDEKRAYLDTEVPPGAYIRFHPEPRRFPVGKIDWLKTIESEEEDFFVVRKPSGVPVHATVDNCQENVAACVSQAVGQRLWVTHRLDVPTQGLLILAKSQGATAKINDLFARGKVRKEYHAIVENDLRPRLYTHTMLKSKRAPRVVVPSGTEVGKECVLEVMGSVPFRNYFNLCLRPRTGRTHQIRVQLSYEGSPIVGDLLYGGKPDTMFENEDHIGLACTELAFSLQGKPYHFRWESQWGSTQLA